MQILKQAKNMLKYLPILAVLVATIIGLFIGKDLYSTSLDSQAKTPIQVLTEPNNPQPPIVLGTIDPCAAIYLSLPPKCKTLDGEFIPLPGTSNILVIPGGK